MTRTRKHGPRLDGAVAAQNGREPAPWTVCAYLRRVAPPERVARFRVTVDALVARGAEEIDRDGPTGLVLPAAGPRGALIVVPEASDLTSLAEAQRRRSASAPAGSEPRARPRTDRSQPPAASAAGRAGGADGLFEL